MNQPMNEPMNEPMNAGVRRSAMRALPTALKMLWALPATLIGLVAGAGCMLAGARVRRHTGVLEVTLRGAGKARRAQRAGHARLARQQASPFARPWPFVAITFGHVVLAASPQDQSRHRAHERVHVRQYERWGPLFLLAYPAESAWQWLRGRRAYVDNRFEVAARRLAGAGGSRSGA
ncbi:MAG: signal peptide prediction [Rubrivivax sp.]